MTGELGWYASIYLWLFFTGIGIPPCPEEAGILYAAGLCALHGELNWPIAWLMTALGIVSADIVLYWVGRWWGPSLFEYRWVRRILSPERRERAEQVLHTHGIRLLLLARLLPPLRTGFFLIAGAARFSFLRFLLADASYAIVGVGLFFFGGTWFIDLVKRTNHFAAYLLAPALILGGLYWYYRYLRNREQRMASQLLSAASENPLSPNSQREERVAERTETHAQ